MLAAMSRAPASAKAEKAPALADARAGAAGPVPANSVWSLLATRVQTKLAVSAPDDPYEREADSVADRVMRMPDRWSGDQKPGSSSFSHRGLAVQRRCKACEDEDEEATLQRKPDGSAATAPESARPPIAQPAARGASLAAFDERCIPAGCVAPRSQTPGILGRRALPAGRPARLGATPDVHHGLLGRARTHDGFSLVQRAPLSIQRACAACEEHEDEEIVQATREGAAPLGPSSELESYIATSRGGGQPLPQSTLERFEWRFGRDLSDVRVHTDAGAARAAAAINSYAFATKSDVHFGAGRFQPGTPQGDRLLAHELTHTIQQTGGRPLAPDTPTAETGAPGHTISRAPAERVQRWPSPGDLLDSIEETVSDAADAAEGAVDTVGGAVGDAVDAVGEGLDKAGEAIGEAADTVVDTGRRVGGAIAEAGEEAIDWLATEAGQLATELADALGVSVNITADGLEIIVPKTCPLDAITEDFDLGSIDKEWMVPIGGIPIGTVEILGEVGLVGHIDPTVEVQLGPVCLNGLRILVNPLTGTFSVSGSVSATAAASLAAEVRGGLRGAVSLKGFVMIGEIPVPVDVPLAGIEGGPAGLIRGIGAATWTMGGSLGIGPGGTISMSETQQLDMGLAGDLFVGAYGQVDILGENLCRIYWQPYEWHGDVAGSIGISLGLTVTPGGSPSVVPTISPPTFSSIPFSQIPLALSREGFSDDCPIKDRICEVLEALGLLPSQNGGVWDWAGPYGPGPRLAGPLDVYQKNPGIPSRAQCRGACGPDCKTCEEIPVHRYLDPVTGDTWEYKKFQDCNTNEGCREHDAAFDWAADVHGEKGGLAIILPWHMAANIECTCNNLAGNCIAWIAGLPPYDDTLYFADSAVLVAHGGGVGPSAESCHEKFPNAPECDASHPDRDAVLEEWGGRNQIVDFRDCAVVTDFTASSLIDCGGGPGNYWNCKATDAVTGQEVIVGIYECICCNDDDTSSSIWMEPHIVFDPTTMSEELILELCARNLIPRVICIPYEDEMIGRFGNRGRDMNIDPDTDPTSRLRPDDAPIVESFKKMYNRLDSWTIYIRTNHPELESEFDATFAVERRREAWLREIKKAGDDFKEEFRNVGTTNPDALREKYNAVLARIEGEIDDLNRRIAGWYKSKTGHPGTVEEIIEEVHQAGTELWRAAWRRAILQVNRVLALLWPPAKHRLLAWVGQMRARHPDKDLSGPVGELDYLGSLASGFKGPPKQNIRFNPESFDVDGFVEAPPLAKYAMFVMLPPVKPKHGNIFARKTDIEPLITFADAAQAELVAKVDGYKNDPADPFDVVIKTEDLPEQARGKAATERLYKLRETLPTGEYEKMVEELRQGGFLDADGTRIREELSESEAEGVKRIMDRFEPPQSPPPPPSPQAPAQATAP